MMAWYVLQSFARSSPVSGWPDRPVPGERAADCGEAGA